MTWLLKLMAGLVNHLHDFLILFTGSIGLNLTDKDLHFWAIGLLGLAVFIFCDIVFRYISKWNISIISFIYTMTVLVVFVFAVEIEQKITGRGNMEFTDIVAGLWGFLVLFAVYVVVRYIVYYFKRQRNKRF